MAVDALSYDISEIDSLIEDFPSLSHNKWNQPKFIRHTKQVEMLILKDTVLLEFNQA